MEILSLDVIIILRNNFDISLETEYKILVQFTRYIEKPSEVEVNTGIIEDTTSPEQPPKESDGTPPQIKVLDEDISEVKSTNDELDAT